MIRTDVGATGIDQVKGIAASTLRDPPAPADTAYGDMVAANLGRDDDDHFFRFRLDLDIDGTANTLLREKLMPQLLPGTTGRRRLWQVSEETIGDLRTARRNTAGKCGVSSTPT